MAAVSATLKLGANAWHNQRTVWRAFKDISDPEWFKAYVNKENRNKDTGKDAEHRWLQSIRVLQRTRDYGLRLLEAGTKVTGTKGCVIDLRQDGKGGWDIRLNTNSAEPMKPGRAPKIKGKRKPRAKTPKSTAKSKA